MQQLIYWYISNLDYIITLHFQEIFITDLKWRRDLTILLSFNLISQDKVRQK